MFCVACWWDQAPGNPVHHVQEHKQQRAPGGGAAVGLVSAPHPHAGLVLLAHLLGDLLLQGGARPRQLCGGLTSYNLPSNNQNLLIVY